MCVRCAVCGLAICAPLGQQDIKAWQRARELARRQAEMQKQGYESLGSKLRAATMQNKVVGRFKSNKQKKKVEPQITPRKRAAAVS